MPSPPASTGRPRRAAGGVIATWVRLAVVTAVGLVQAPILFGHVPARELGVWYLFFAVATFISLSDLGLPATFGRAVAYLTGSARSGDAGEQIPSLYRAVSLSELYASALLSTALLSLALALLAFPAALVYFARALPAMQQRTLVLPLLVFLGGVVFNLVAIIPGACLSGSGEVALDNAVRSAANLIGLGLVCVLVPRHPDLHTLCTIYLIQGIAALVASHLALTRRGRIGRRGELRLNVPLIRSLYRESAAIFTSRVGLWLTAESTLLIAGYFLGSERLADFGLLRQVIAIGASLAGAIPVAISPHAAAAHAAGDKDKVRSLYLATVRYSLVANVLWTLGLLLWAPAVIGLLVGPRHFLGTAVLVPLALASFLELHAMTHAFFVWNMGHWPFAPWVVAGGVLNVVLASAGCAFLGFPGLAWGSLAAQAVTVHWIQVSVALHRMGIAFRLYLRDTILRTLGYAAAVALAGAAVRAFAAPGLAGGARLTGAVWAGAGIVATALLAAAFAWPLMLTKGDRGYFLDLVGFSSR